MAYNNVPISFKNLLDEASRILGMHLPTYGSNFVAGRYESWVELQPTKKRFFGLPTLFRDDSEQVAARRLSNCSLQGPVQDLSRIPSLGYLDLSRNQLHGSIPSNQLSDEITTMYELLFNSVCYALSVSI
ncbi:hypothetical protein IFM89_036646 [Coptis chinensis]|uniref:Uncharacterized protein n=1 Tax=Coptis chinensis TaxID=261450 RepID=A0A835IJB0_9MAGN|nr:hypothetical protein IFM89_036646 [Coptis chinensis]